MEKKSNRKSFNLECGVSWPPKCYACSFCKREFKSAQALGGHMNVHRRDRARLRHSFPGHNQHNHPNPNPNPNFSSSSSSSPSSPPSAKFLHSNLADPSLPSPCFTGFCLPSSASTDEEINEDAMEKEKKKKKNDNGKIVGKVKISMQEDVVNFLKNGKNTRSDPKQNLDLELRLGCSINH